MLPTGDDGRVEATMEQRTDPSRCHGGTGCRTAQ